MEKLSNQHNNLEALRQEIYDRMNEILANPLSEEDLEKLSDDEIKNASLQVQTLPEFHIALQVLAEKGVPREVLLDMLEHENAHANIAEVLDVNFQGYRIIPVSHHDGASLQPQVRIGLPDDWSQEKREQVLREIIMAPDVYGNSLSEFDKKDLEDLFE